MVSKGQWAPCGGLDDISAFKASEKALPVYSLGIRLPSQSDLQKALPTEPAARGTLVKEVNVTKFPISQSYTMGTRSAGIIPPVLGEPGPGHYPIPSTVQATHPSDVQTARAFAFSASKTGRSNLGGGPTPGPGPLKYGQKQIASAPVLRDAPHWTAAGRANDPDLSVKEKRPGCQTYVVKGLLRDGPIFAPAWSLGERRSGVSNTRSKWPGPDKFNVNIEANGRKNKNPKWEFYKTDRFPAPSEHKKKGPFPPY